MNRLTLSSMGTNMDSEAFSVKMHGAVGDGVTDDTEAFQNALNKLPSGRTLNIPLGKYLIKKNLDISSDTTIKGTTGSEVLIGTYLDEFITIKGQKNVELDGLNITCSYATSGGVMLVEKSQNVTVKNSTIKGMSTYDKNEKKMVGGCLRGMRFIDCENVQVLGNVMSGFRGTHGISTKMTTGIRIEDNDISHTNRAGISINSGSIDCIVAGNRLSFNQLNFAEDGAIDMYGSVPECENVIISHNIISDVVGIPGDGQERNNSYVRLKDGINIRVEHNLFIVNAPIWCVIFIQGRDANAELKDTNTGRVLDVSKVESIVFKENITKAYGVGNAPIRIRDGCGTVTITNNIIKTPREGRPYQIEDKPDTLVINNNS